MTSCDRIEANLVRVREQIAEAALSRHRRPEDVRLVAVTKAADFQAAACLAGLGHGDLGENRAGQLQQRAAAAAEAGLDVRWHMIGHLQRRKVRDLLPHIALIHSVDSLRLAHEIDKRAAEANLPPVNILLEVNVSGEQQKYGLAPDHVADVARQADALEHVALEGLMTMAPLADDPEQARPVFRALRALRDRLNDDGTTARPLVDLSMGMSQDYAVAVQEGATLVRVGSALWA